MRHILSRTLLSVAVVSALAAAAPAGRAPLAAPGQRPTEEEREAAEARRLSENGPQLPDTYSPSDLTFKAFVSHSWPVYIEYELERPAVVSLNLRFASFPNCPTYPHNFGPRPAGPHKEHFRIPKGFAYDGPHATYYTLKAVDPLTGRLAPLRLHTFAAGHGVADPPAPPGSPAPRRAALGAGFAHAFFAPPAQTVGPQGFDAISFSPSEVAARRRERATYGFRATLDFDRVTVHFRHGSRGRDGEIVIRRVGSKQHDERPLKGKLITDDWDCLAGGRASIGVHDLEVMGHLTEGHGGGFLMTTSHPQTVNIR